MIGGRGRLQPKGQPAEAILPEETPEGSLVPVLFSDADLPIPLLTVQTAEDSRLAESVEYLRARQRKRIVVRFCDLV